MGDVIATTTQCQYSFISVIFQLKLRKFEIDQVYCGCCCRYYYFILFLIFSLAQVEEGIIHHITSAWLLLCIEGRLIIFNAKTTCIKSTKFSFLYWNVYIYTHFILFKRVQTVYLTFDDIFPAMKQSPTVFQKQVTKSRHVLSSSLYMNSGSCEGDEWK